MLMHHDAPHSQKKSISGKSQLGTDSCQHPGSAFNSGTVFERSRQKSLVASLAIAVAMPHVASISEGTAALSRR